MVIGIDLGNTNTVIGIYKESEISPTIKFRFQTDRNITSDEIALNIFNILGLYNVSLKNIKGGIISSVVPSLDIRYNEFFERFLGFSPLYVSYKLSLPIKIKYKNKNEIGADRIVNAVAVYELYGGNKIIVDFGTATTFCILLEDGTYLGGLIGPGISTSLKALLSNADKLPKIELKKPSKIIADNTIENIQSGFVYGFYAMMKGIKELVEEELQRQFDIIITGGFSSLFSSLKGIKILVDIDLTLKGLKILYDKIRRKT